MDIEMFTAQENEKPLDRMVADGGFCGIFRTVGCIGDSLASGEFEAGINENGERILRDFYEYSWGQYLARATGCKAYNFSCGGMTAEVYYERYAERNGFWDKDKVCQAYIIALGVNDLLTPPEPKIGSVADIDRDNYKNNKKNFAGYYAGIIQRLKEMQPDAKFFLVTMPRLDTETERKKHLSDKHAELMYDLADFFSNSYVIDLRRYAPVYDAKFRESFYLGGHMNPCGYMLTAKMIMSYIDYIIRHNMEDFKSAGLIGTPYTNMTE